MTARTTHREQLQVLCDQTSVAVVATLALGGLVTAFLAVQVEHGPLAAWYGGLVVVALLRLVLGRAARRVAATTPEPLRWMWRFAALSVLTGAVWGWHAVLYLRPDEPLVFGMCIVAIAGICSAAIGSLSAFLPACWVFLAACLVPVLALSLARGDLRGVVMFVMVLVFLGANFAFARVANRTLVESFRLRAAKDQLVADLLHEKERALAAQHRAELAVLAKSRFLAAASHDLRQPAHALGLYVGALRQRVSADPALVQLTERIDASTHALEELLDGILDISRLDADALRPEVAAFPLEAILRRVVDELADTAAEKGVELRLAPTTMWVRSDARLLERMLRNLVGNAVRYTDRGKVLVGVRAGSTAARVCVWDQGCGIASVHHEEIFEEFRQLHNPERDRARGLGLGLAIVRRIGNLLGHAVAVRSTVGRGSCFSIELPVCEPAPASAMPRAAAAPDLAGVTVLVIDDEGLAREALAALVSGWGCHTVLAGSGAEAVRAIAGESRIDAIVADWRLRDEETGCAAVSAVRAALGAQVPALVVTGDTTEERIREVQASGLPLAHKPVPPAELRALLAALVARGAG
ncbi:MAG: hybrid sensor histidine kinase/response regulator [Deltaproteobacteria bacterium]|nr:hybrid sensor histidine kinase/response regulator [Deltaproteobacteria bacterium]